MPADILVEIEAAIQASDDCRRHPEYRFDERRAVRREEVRVIAVRDGWADPEEDDEADPVPVEHGGEAGGA